MAVRPRRIPAVALVGVALTACYPAVPPGENFSPRWARVLSGPMNEDEFDGIADAPVSGSYAVEVDPAGSVASTW